MDKEMRNMLMVSAVAAVVIFVGFVAYSSQESRVFNKLTGSNTTTMDAFFVQLRVIEPAQEGGE